MRYTLAYRKSVQCTPVCNLVFSMYTTFTLYNTYLFWILPHTYVYRFIYFCSNAFLLCSIVSLMQLHVVYIVPKYIYIYYQCYFFIYVLYINFKQSSNFYFYPYDACLDKAFHSNAIAPQLRFAFMLNLCYVII